MRDAVAEALEGVLVLGLDDLASEDVALVPDALDLNLELEGTEFEQLNDLQVGAVHDIAGAQEDDVLLYVDLLILHLGGDVLLLKEVRHLDVDVCRAHGDHHVDVAHLAVLAVRVQAVLLDELVHLRQVALREDAAVHAFEAFNELLHASAFL